MLPHVLFTAHEHKSMIISTDALLRREFQIVPVTRDNNQAFEYTLGTTDMYEILIPTCSYRMGTTKIGFGYAVIGKYLVITSSHLSFYRNLRDKEFYLWNIKNV